MGFDQGVKKRTSAAEAGCQKSVSRTKSVPQMLKGVIGGALEEKARG